MYISPKIIDIDPYSLFSDTESNEANVFNALSRWSDNFMPERWGGESKEKAGKGNYSHSFMQYFSQFNIAILYSY